MQIDIQALNFALTQGLRSQIERRLAFALSTRDEQIRRIRVRLTDINGPKGGEDMCCHIQVTLNGLPDVVVKDVEADLYTAIDRAADRAGRTVSRQLDRRRTKQRASDPKHNDLTQTFDQSIGDLSA